MNDVTVGNNTSLLSEGAFEGLDKVTSHTIQPDYA